MMLVFRLPLLEFTGMTEIFYGTKWIVIKTIQPGMLQKVGVQYKIKIFDGNHSVCSKV